MKTKAMNMKWDEAELTEMKRIAAVFNMTLTDLVKTACREYVIELKTDPYYRLTANVEEASSEESEELLSEIDKLSDDDLRITSSRTIEL